MQTAFLNPGATKYITHRVTENLCSWDYNLSVALLRLVSEEPYFLPQIISSDSKNLCSWDYNLLVALSRLVSGKPYFLPQIISSQQQEKPAKKKDRRETVFVIGKKCSRD